MQFRSMHDAGDKAKRSNAASILSIYFYTTENTKLRSHAYEICSIKKFSEFKKY